MTSGSPQSRSPQSRNWPSVAVIAPRGEERYEAVEVAREIGLPLVDDASGFDLELVLGQHGWSLRVPGGRGAGARCDLTSGELGRRLREAIQRGPTRGDRLARSLGLPGAGRDTPLRVLDATAGLGRESVLAAAFGCDVIACERSAVVAHLLRDGLRRAAAHPELAPVVARVEVRARDAREVIASLTEAERPDVVLIDPMFPERQKAALVKQEMQVLQRLLGEQTDDAPELLAAALPVARRRVVVKRPAHAPSTEGERTPDITIPGRAARYDVYLVR